ncbi:MAG: type II secretion system protein [Gammaproteobacteria bacterium]
MKRIRGFSLIELAIVLVIVTLLIGGLAVPLTAQIQARRIAETKKTLEEAREAIIGYAMSHSISNKCTCTYNSDGVLALTSLPPSSCNPHASPDTWCPKTGTPGQSSTETYIRHYLPCPDTDANGSETRTGNVCSGASGLLPWVDLGTASQDAWGNRLHYSVENREYADKSKGLPGPPNNPSERDPPYSGLSLKRICSDSTCTTLVADNLPAVVLSYGPNGRGARNKNIEASNPTPAPPSNTGADELENINGGPNFVSRDPFKANDENEDGNDFDDLVVWISDGVLRGRVCPPGGCP